MFPYRRIVFPVDFSQANLAIVPFVSDLVRHFQAELHLIHACAPEIFYAAEFGWQIAADTPATQEIEKAQRERLQAFARERFPGIEVETTCQSGHAATVIEAVVRSRGADLIMLPTHGHTLFRRLLLGSITTRLIHDLSCSVWTACHMDQSDAATHIPYRRILCAVEPGMDNAHVVKAAEGMALAYGAAVSLVSAIEWPTSDPAVDPGNYWDRIRTSAEEQLAAFRQSLPMAATANLVYGPIARVLREEATRQSADLLIVGRGDAQSPLSGMLSNLYSIVREAPCPVLSV